MAGSVILTVGDNNASSTFSGKIQNTAGTLGINKIGNGTLTILGTNNTYNGATTISQGIVKLGERYSTFITTKGVTHRWSFNGSLADSVGSSNATIVDVGANNVTLSSTQATMTGGARSSSDYIQLGTDLLPNTNTAMTIELWATPQSIQTWSRIFDFGSSDTENLFMSWTQGISPNTDKVGWKHGSTYDWVVNSNQPYTLGTEYHIVMTLTPSGSTTQVSWYSAPSGSANLGSMKGTFTTSNTLANFLDSVDNLGRSSYSADGTANASYNEFRIWVGALDSTTLETLHDAGTDADLSSYTEGYINTYTTSGNLPSTTDLILSSSGATLDLNGFNQTVASLSGVAGSSVLLGSGTLTVGGDNASTTFAGTISGAGGIIKTGTGTLILGASNSYTGPTALNAGALRMAHANALGNATTALSIPGGTGSARLEFVNNISVARNIVLNGRGASPGENLAPHLVNAGNNNTLTGNISLAESGYDYVIQSDAGELSLAGNIINNTGNATERYLYLQGAGDGEFTGTISNGTGSGLINLLKDGAGTWTLTQDVDLLGDISVLDGVLEVANINLPAAAVDVQSGAELIADSLIINHIFIGSGSKLVIQPTGLSEPLSMTPVPEPSSLILLIVGGLSYCLFCTLRKKK